MSITFILNDYPKTGKVVLSDQAKDWYWPIILQAADTVFLQPGDSPSLIRLLDSVGLDANKLDGKTVYAISAGVSALTIASVNFDHNTLVKGLGILPFTSIVHYQESMEWASEYLQLKYPGVPTLKVYDDTIYTISISIDGKLKGYSEKKRPAPTTNQIALPQVK